MKRILIAGLVLSTLFLGVAAALPHWHADEAAAARPHACLLCRAQQSFFDTPLHVWMIGFVLAGLLLFLEQSDRHTVSPIRFYGSRAPPALA